MKRIYITLMLLLTIVGGAAAQETGEDNYEYQRGREAYDNKDYLEAANHFYNAIVADYINVYALGYMGRCFYQMGDMGKSLSSTRYALELTPKRDKAFIAQLYAWKADTYYAIDDTLAALGAIETALQYEPKSTDYLVTCGMLHVHLKHYDQADSYALQALKVDTACLEARRVLVYSAVYRKQWSEVERLANEVIKRDTTHSSYVYLVESALHLGKTERAIALLPYACRYVGYTNATEALTDSLAKRDYAATDTALAQGAARWPDDADLLLARVGAAFATNRGRSALNYTKQYVKLVGDESFNRYVASVYDGMYDFDAALETMRTTLRTDSTSEQTLFQMGLALYRKGLYHEALSYFDQAVDAAPTDANAYFRRAQVYRALGQGAEALTDAEYAATLDTTQAGLQYEMARCLRLMGRGQEARPYLERIMRIDTAENRGNCRRLFALYYLGRTDEAKKQCEAMLAKEEADYKAGHLAQPDGYKWFAASQLAALMGDNQQALKYLRRALELNVRLSAPNRADSSYDTLRTMPEFQALMKEFDTKPTQWK